MYSGLIMTHLATVFSFHVNYKCCWFGSFFLMTQIWWLVHVSNIYNFCVHWSRRQCWMKNSACERRKGVRVWSKCERRNLFCALCEGEWGCLKYYRLLTILIFFCALADPHEFFCHQKLCVNSDKKIQFYEINI